MPVRAFTSFHRLKVIVFIVLVINGLLWFQGSVFSSDSSTTIALENEPRMLAVNPVTNRVAVTHWRSNSISIVDINAERLIAQIPVGMLPKGVAIDEEMNIAVLTNQGERTITLIDLNKNQIAADIYIGMPTGHVAVNSRTHIAAVTSMIDFHAYFIDLTQRKVLAKIPVGLGMTDIAIDAQRNTAFIVNPLTRSLKMIDMNTWRVSDTLLLGKMPNAIDVNPETQKALITSYWDRNVLEVDLLTKRLLNIPANCYCVDVAYNSIDNRAVILCEREQKLLLMDLNTHNILNTYALPRHPKSVVVNSLKNIAIVADDETDGLTIIPLPLSPSLPKIKITTPVDNAQIATETVKVTGVVENSVSVTVNGVMAMISGKTFEATLTLKAGQNTIAAVVTDKYGRTACHDVLVNIVLPQKAKITGAVTNAVTGALLPLAIVTITDSTGNKQTIATILSGNYTAEIAPGAFTCFIIKPWFLPYSFAGRANAGETATVNAALIPADPEISNIAVSDLTPNSAKIYWTTDQPAQGTVQYGATTNYGSSATGDSEQTAHSVTLTNLTPATTYHFRVEAMSANGVTIYSADSTFKTPGKIDLTITSPADGATVSGNSVMVTGSVANLANVETGVTVNGIPATLANNQFTVNNVPLNAGQNTITVSAVDVSGATVSKSININADKSAHYIKLDAYPESGVAPMEVSLKLNGSFTINNPTSTFNGPGAVEQVTSENPEEYKYKLSTEGVYYFTVQAVGPDGNTYSNTAAVTVLPRNMIDALLKSKWSGLTEALQRGDTAAALSLMLPSRRDNYEVVFNVLKDKWPAITASYKSFTLISMEASVATYELAAMKNGKTYVYQIDFRQDASGLWFIDEF